MKNYIYSYLKCIVYDKLLKPRQSFRITLYSIKSFLKKFQKILEKTNSFHLLGNLTSCEKKEAIDNELGKKVKVRQSRYRPGVAQRVPGS